MSQPVDSSILHEIVRIIDSRRKVPDKVIVTSKEYLLTYLEDHRRRLEEALMRFDGDRLNMLYGQLASKVKYQLLRRVPAKAAAAVGISVPKAKPKPAAKPAAKVAKPAKSAKSAKPAKPAAKRVAAKTPARPVKKAAAAKKKPAPAKKKPTSAKAKAKPAARRAAARPKKKARR